MRIIKEIAKRIKEELHDAEWYAEKALEHKAMHPDLSEVYIRLAKEEHAHSTLLHDKVVALIRKASSEKEVPPAMREMWEWQHGEIIEEEAEVKRLLEMYASHT